MTDTIENTRSPVASRPFVPLEARMSWTVTGAALVAGLPEKAVRAAANNGDLITFTLPGSTTKHIRREDLHDWVMGL